jgi:hypothetical protein
VALAFERARGALSELALLEVLQQVLPTILQAEITAEPRLGQMRPDFLATWPGTGQQAIIEAKGVTPNTHRRLDDVAKQLARYAYAYRKAYPNRPPPELILAVPEIFSPAHIEFLYNAGVNRIIDGPQIRAVAGETALTDSMAESTVLLPPDIQASIDKLLIRLGGTPPGRADWSTYQTLCGDILSFLLCPPLAQPIRESANQSKINRRDFIFPNYATDGYWNFMRSYYEAHYAVVDAKNYVGSVKKESILQVANYLSTHGAGQFGIIVTRTGGDRSAELTRREQWILHRKMIILLNDDDMRQMLSLHAADTDPAELIRQKIEDFRLGF